MTDMIGDAAGKTGNRAARVCDVAVIGAGPSGLAAAVELRRLGVARVLVLEREADPGGVPRHCGHPPFGLLAYRRFMTGPAYARRLAEEAAHAGVEVLTRATVMRMHAGGVLSVSLPDGALEVRAARVLIATGARETPRSARLVGGARALGVLNTGALQGMVYLKNLVPFRRPLVVGTELVSFSALYTCRRAGIRPAAMIEENARPTVRWPLHHAARLFGTPLRLGARIEAIEGRGRVEAVRLRDGEGRISELACDGVLFTGRFTPEASLARMSHLAIDPGTGGPEVDQFGRCSDPAYFAAGNLLRPVENHEWCWSEGRQAARRIRRDLDGALPAAGAEIPVVVSAPLRYCLPQRLSPMPHAAAMRRFQLRVSAPARGRLCLTDGENLLYARPIRAMPEQRILLPLPRLDEIPPGRTLRVSIV